MAETDRNTWAAKVHRTRGLPLYVQIRESLREKIAAGEIAVGEQLPGEQELAKQFGVSRMTLRQAIDDLAREGHLRVLHGRGVIVVSRKVRRDSGRLTGFHEDVSARNMVPSSRLLRRQIVPADAVAAENLAIQPGDPVIFCSRLRLADGQVFACNYVHSPAALCPWLESADLERESLYVLYETHGLKLEWAHQVVEARPASPEQARELDLDPGSPVLYVERTTYATGNLPIEWTYAVGLPGLYSLEMTLYR
jgi:GntR family transcriptional regulator